jgi:signal transduction histidine kinase
MTTATSRVPSFPQLLPHDLDASAIFAVVLVSSRGHVVAANERFRSLLGYDTPEALLKRKLPTDFLRRSADWNDWQSVANGGDARDIKAELVARDKSSVHVVGRIERLLLANGDAFVRGTLVDDRASHHLQVLSLRTARTEGALGLAAGISHDFNNLLTVLVGNLYLVSELVRNDPVLHEKVRKARDAAKRGAGFARQLLDVAQGANAESDAAAVNPKRVVETLSPLLSAVLGSRIALKTVSADDLPSVFVNRAQLESVITNLVINARDAIGDKTNGTVTIALDKRELSPTAGTALRLNAGTYVQISVRDDGCGIPPELADRVFEPFFSTKAKGKGSGLGLPMVRWFAEKADGTAYLESRRAEGTVVTVLLPAHQVLAPEATGTMPLSALPIGTEKIVVFSEDVDFRSTVEQILSTLGYQVGPESLLDKADPTDRPTRAVLVVDAHVLSTPEAERIRAFVDRRGPAVGVVVVGHSRLDWPIAPIRAPKPFSLIELARAVRAAADGGD